MKTTLSRLPDNTKRLLILGATGSGKTQAALWHLSKRNFDKMPWVIIDYKHDDGIATLPCEEWDSPKCPKKAGLYAVRPLPDDDIEPLLWDIWDRENVGLYIDEGYMIGRDNKALNAILTQGRSKRIPLIMLSQRPSWISRFCYSEADFFQVFRLTDSRDRKTVEAFLPTALERLPEYHSVYYDVGRDRLDKWGPCPLSDDLQDVFEEKSAMKRLKRI